MQELAPNPIETIQLFAFFIIGFLGLVAPQLVPLAMAWIVAAL